MKWLIFISVHLVLYGWVGFAVLYSVNRILFSSVILIFVDVGGGGELLVCVATAQNGPRAPHC